MPYTFLIDFGSTFTKLCVVDFDNGELVMTAKHPSTVATDASIGLLATFEDAKGFVGERGVKNAEFYASSSAAGGLRMVVVGLTKRFSLLAGRNVALGAGARVIKAYANDLTLEDIREIEQINPEILLFCGGIEGGNEERVMGNAKMLRRARISAHIIYAGNTSIAAYVRKELVSAGLHCYLTENVFPEYGKINAKMTGEIVRDLFMNRIAGAKGCASVFPIIGNVLMPTPAAVFDGGMLLSCGAQDISGFGPAMVFDIGGATTDVYSYGDEKQENRKHVGAPEAYGKRTVEGDLGVRSSCMSLLEWVNGEDAAGAAGISKDEYGKWCEIRAENSDFVPEDQVQRKIDLTLAQAAVRNGARRHCGQVMDAYAKKACKTIEGKDLSGIHKIVGTGGPIIHSSDPIRVLEQALGQPGEEIFLLPKEAEYYLDEKYILYAIGLGAKVNKRSAMHIAKENIKPILK